VVSNLDQLDAEVDVFESRTTPHSERLTTTNSVPTATHTDPQNYWSHEAPSHHHTQETTTQSPISQSQTSRVMSDIQRYSSPSSLSPLAIESQYEVSRRNSIGQYEQISYRSDDSVNMPSRRDTTRENSAG
jgi:hypothetical protein